MWNNLTEVAASPHCMKVEIDCTHFQSSLVVVDVQLDVVFAADIVDAAADGDG